MTPLLKKTSLGMLAALVVVLILRAATEERVLEIIVGKTIPRNRGNPRSNQGRGIV